jgi:hypothetical protein
MKLSMWMLFDELEAYGATSAIQDGRCELTSVRVFTYEESLSNAYVYIGSAHDFFDNNSEQVLLVHGHDIIFVNKMDVSEVLNRVIRVFDKYREWDERLRKACIDTNAFQAILDVAHEAFQCPMFFGHKNLRIFAITRQYPEEEVYEGWDEVKALGTMPLSLLKKTKVPFDMSKYPDTLDPVAISTAGDSNKFFDYQIRANCYFNGGIWGHLYLYYKKPVVSPTVMQLARYVADIYGEILSKTLGKNVEKYMKYSFLVDMLDGKEKSSEALLNLYWQLQWEESSKLVLYKVTPLPKDYDGVMFDWLCDSIAEKAVNSIVFPYKNSIVVVAQRKDNKQSVLLSNIQSLISLRNYHCGVSYTFIGLKNIVYHYYQAGYAIECSSDPVNRTHFFTDCAFSGFVSFVKTRFSWRSFVMPSLFKLLEIDADQGTEYYKTLYCLLVNKGHCSNTSADLYIHRNTLKYRLDKITQILGTDIYNESMSTYLRFCYEMLKEDFPVTLPERQSDRSISC